MKVIKSEKNIILRLDRNEEIISSLELISRKEDIKSAFISGIGALEYVCIGRYKISSKEFIKKEFSGEFEVVSILGNMSLLENNEINIHLHISLADNNFNLFGGHLVKGIVSATMELKITVEKKELKRIYNENLGLNLLN